MPLPKIVIATHNPHKRDDLIHYVHHTFECVPIADFTLHEPLETGETFEANALLKARFSYDVTGLPSLADDSGFCMKNLNGMPGIYAARFAINNKGETDYLHAFNTLEQQLGDQDPATDFVCTLVYKDAHGEKVFQGTVPGFFDFSKKHTPGFGYTPLFVPLENNPQKLSLADMGDPQRRTFSARKKAAFDFLQWVTQSKK